MITTRIFPDPSTVAQAAVEALLDDLKAAIEDYGSATWVVAGGSTPMLAYEILAKTAVKTIDWSKVNIVIGDERCVPFDSPDASWTQIQMALLDHLRLPANVARPRTDLPAEEAAQQYDQYLLQLPKDEDGLLRLDIVWLGMGEDGHTLSLFPNHPSLLAETGRLVIPVHDSPKPPSDRISLTFKALQGASHCVVLATGSGKAAAVARALAGDESLPVAQAATVVNRAGGVVSWLLDSAAAEEI